MSDLTDRHPDWGLEEWKKLSILNEATLNKASIDIHELQERFNRLTESTQAFVDKLDECQSHIDGAFQMAFEIRGHKYKGPDYGEELKTLRMSLNPCVDGHDLVSKSDGTARCVDCGELVDTSETGAARLRNSSTGTGSDKNETELT